MEEENMSQREEGYGKAKLHHLLLQQSVCLPLQISHLVKCHIFDNLNLGRHACFHKGTLLYILNVHERGCQDLVKSHDN